MRTVLVISDDEFQGTWDVEEGNYNPITYVVDGKIIRELKLTQTITLRSSNEGS